MVYTKTQCFTYFDFFPFRILFGFLMYGKLEVLHILSNCSSKLVGMSTLEEKFVLQSMLRIGLFWILNV